MHQEERQVGSYRLDKHLEHGILADAYLATHISTEKQVIVKVFQGTLSEELLAQCMASLHAYARLEHPDILRLLDFDEESNVNTNSLFLVIDTPGETLRQRHPQRLPLPLDTIALYVSQIASALQFAHNQHVLHLDLSPEHLSIGSNGRIMLDYTNRLLSSVSPTFISTDALYTPHESSGSASDQYALAMISYEWLSGALPLNDITREAADKERTLLAPGEPASSIWPRVEPILNRALALEPAQRYENIQSFAQAFLLALNVGPEVARLKQEIQRQHSFSGGESFGVAMGSSITVGYQQTAANWHNPFRSGFSFTIHSIGTLAFSPDGKHLAFNSHESAVYIAEITETGTLFTYQGHIDPVSAVAWSPDGQTIASMSSNETTGDIQIWEAATGKLLSTYNVHPSVSELQWSPDGKFMSILAIGGEDRRVEIVNRVSGKVLICRAPAALIEEIGHGEVPQDETMTMTNTSSLSTGQTTMTTITTTTTTPPSGLPVVRTARRQHRTVKVWGGKDARDTVTYFGHRSVVKPLAWSPDGSRIASGGYDGSIHVWDAVTSTAIFIYRGHLDPVVAVAWSPDGTRLASGSLDHTVKIWDLLTGQEILTYSGHKNFVQAIVWSPDSTRLASGSEDTTVQVWDARSGKTILTYNEHTAAISSVDWSIDGERIASGSYDQTVHIWEAATGNTVFVYRNHTAAVQAVAWSPDGNRVASSSAQRWRNYGESIHRPDHEAMLHIWTARADQTGTIYGQDEHPGIRQDRGRIAWSPDGQMIAAQDISYVRVYDTSTGESMAIIMNYEHGKQIEKIHDIAWSSDGTRIAGSLSNGRVQVWPARVQSS